MNRAVLAEWLRFYRDMGVDNLRLSSEVLNVKQTDSLEDLHNRIRSCSRCDLHKTRHHAVPGEGSPHPEILFVGEAPGQQEDQVGKPFVGKAGQLLDRLIQRMGYGRDAVFISNIVKCRPPGNRDPNMDEVAACLPFLRRQIALLTPRVIVCLGKVAANSLLGSQTPISRLRGRVWSFEKIPVVCTYHPSFILHQRGPEAVSKSKWEVWADMQEVLKILNR